MSGHLRTLRLAAWLGWQMESNWTTPWLFAVYVLLRPIAGSLLLVCMFFAVKAVNQDELPDAFLPFLYVSNACYMLVGAVMFGMSWVVISDREHYGMLKYVYISPVPIRTYLVGRGLSRGLEALLGATVTIGVGIWCFHEVGAALAGHRQDWGWLFFFLAAGFVLLVTLGLILAGTVLNMARHGMFLSEGIAGVLYLLSGAVFPIESLPPWLQPVSMVLPVTYWMEGMRRALLGPAQLPSLSGWSNTELAVALIVSTALLGVVAHYYFRWAERRAWRLGKFDQVSGW